MAKDVEVGSVKEGKKMYQFPVIHTIDDVLPFVKDHDSIVVADKGDYTWIDYVVDDSIIFNPKYAGWEMRRECRGLLFDTKGQIVSRPFHKFFNVNQLEETQANLIDMSRDHTIMVKEDGSMVRPFMIDEEIRWGTRKGESDTITSLRKDFPEYFKLKVNQGGLCAHICNLNRTPIFEYAGPNNKHVVSYEEPRLIMLATRDNFTGQYYDIYNNRFHREHFDLVDMLESPNNIEEFMETIRVLKGSEGAVITFGNEYYKVKAEDYVLKHRARDAVAKKRHIWTMILDGTLDDFIPLLNDADKAIVDETEKEFWKLWHQTSFHIDRMTFSVVTTFASKKDFAMNGDKNGIFRQFAFGRFDGKDMNEMLNEHIRKHLNQDIKQVELEEWMKSFV